LGRVFIESGFPFAMEINAAISSAILLVVAGLAGSALSVRLITRVDPIIALGAQK
jgi:ABC-type antimicrobial peptide transport system permease subunit